MFRQILHIFVLLLVLWIVVLIIGDSLGPPPGPQEPFEPQEAFELPSNLHLINNDSCCFPQNARVDSIPHHLKSNRTRNLMDLYISRRVQHLIFYDLRKIIGRYGEIEGKQPKRLFYKNDSLPIGVELAMSYPRARGSFSYSVEIYLISKSTTESYEQQFSCKITHRSTNHACSVDRLFSNRNELKSDWYKVEALIQQDTLAFGYIKIE